MYNNEWITGLLVTYIVAVCCLLAIIVSLKWYRPAMSLSAPVSMLLATMVIVGLASYDMLENGRGAQLSAQTEQAKLYKQLQWQQEENAEFTLSQALKLWDEQPSANSKLLLGLSYLQAAQPDKGVRVIAEALQGGGSHLYLSKTEREMLASELGLPEGEGAEAFAGYSLPMSANEYASAADEVVEAMQRRLSDEVADEKEQEWQVLAKLDPERVDYVIQISTANGTQDASAVGQIEEIYDRTVERLVEDDSSGPENAALEIELAKTAIYMNDHASAQKLLTNVLRHYPDATEPAVLLGEMLLNDRASAAEEQLEMLPAYAEAKLRQQKEEKRLLVEWSEQVGPGDSEAAALVGNRLHTIQSEASMQPHLAYTLLQPHESEDEPQVKFLLSAYHYQMKNLEQSAAYIHQLADDPAKLTLPQQYYVQALQSLPATEDMTQEEWQIRNELTNDVYRSFQTLGGKRKNESEPTDTEKGFAVYLSNELIALNKSSIRITSVQGKETGEVELYITADNMKNLTPSTLQIHDNGTEVSSFTLEKVGESVSYERNIALIVDRSGSMDGERIEGAKLALQNFIGSMKNNERVGLLAFDDSSQVMSPMTNDAGAVHESILSLNPGGGTNIGGAFHHGLDLVEAQSGERILFILSDGEDSTFSQPETRAAIIKRANESGVTIFAIGFASGYETLRDVAEGTGGRYIASAGLDDLLNSFEEIKATLESSYKITYKLSPMDTGLHRVRLTSADKKSATKTYTIGQESDDPSDKPALADAVKVDAEESDFAINGTTPNRITASKLGTTKVQIAGIGFDKVEKVLLDQKEMKFTKVNDGRIDMTVANNQSIGIHKLKLIAKDQREVEYNLSVAKSGEQEYRDFGDARVYGDFIEDQAGVSKLQGNTSVDHFIYDSRGAMTLTGGKELTFSGLQVDVDRTKIGLLASAAVEVDNFEERYLPDKVTMTVQADQKTFEVKRANLATKVLDKFTLGKFGLEIYMNPQFTYEAKYSNDDGTLTAEAGISGFSSYTALNDSLAAKWTKALKFMPTDAKLSFGYEKQNVIVSGELGAALNLGTLVETGTIMVTAAYEHGPGKLDLGLEVEDLSGQFRAFSFDLQRLPINKFGLKVGWQGGMLPKAGEILIGVPKGIPLGTTGMTVRMMKVGIDGRDGFGGLLGTEVGTAVDGPVQEVITWINRLPLFEISDTACVLCVEGEAGVKNLGTAGWSVSGSLALKVIGFEASKGSVYIDVNEISSAISISYLGLEGNNRLLWKDKSYNKDLTITTRGSVSFLGLDGELVIFVDATRFKKSYVDLMADTWFGDPHIHIGADAVVYR